jgi:hypothetical protein
MDISMKQEACDDINWSDDNEIFKHIEKQYWDYVENQIGDDYKVEYAADLNAQVYGNGFGMPNQKAQDANQIKYIKHPWNLANL